MHPHAVFYQSSSEGVTNPPGGIAPQQKWTYKWYVPERAGPGPEDASSILWLYHSHNNVAKDTETGLVGPMIITNKDNNQDGVADDIDREIFQLYHVFDENLSWYLNQNILFIPGTTSKNVLLTSTDFQQSNLKHSVNGRMYNTVPNLKMCLGEQVRWYLADMGQTPKDPHTFHWHANTAQERGVTKDVVFLLPGSMHTLTMVPDDLGSWNSHCHIDSHNQAGMNTKYLVQVCQPASPPFVPTPPVVISPPFIIPPPPPVIISPPVVILPVPIINQPINAPFSLTDILDEAGLGISSAVVVSSSMFVIVLLLVMAAFF